MYVVVVHTKLEQTIVQFISQFAKPRRSSQHHQYKMGSDFPTPPASFARVRSWRCVVKNPSVSCLAALEEKTELTPKTRFICWTNEDQRLELFIYNRDYASLKKMKTYIPEGWWEPLAAFAPTIERLKKSVSYKELGDAPRTKKQAKRRVEYMCVVCKKRKLDDLLSPISEE